ncbi:MAG: phenylalanine--tRNA ligase subunit alpha [Betaproteobacteria bacterium]|nr:phenylalanine--tRNA ligase subunit alpha [Betaproteobacteria bacterium]
MSSLEQILMDARLSMSKASSLPELEQAKARFLGKNGIVTAQLKGLSLLDVEARKLAGAAVNRCKAEIELLVESAKERIAEADLQAKLAEESIDVTLPGRNPGMGSLHPVSLALERIEKLFASVGFSVADGPEIETDENNFAMLNMPVDHPARSMQDTFYLKGTSNVLRTHTSPVQIRYMQEHSKKCGPPYRIICPGRVYRCDHDATHSPMFHQIEGLWVDTGISLADLKATLTQLFRMFFERESINIRFRPSYFPFVEPGVEVDMEWESKGGKVKWLEIGGAGVVHPQVLRNGGVDPERYSGFAFGMGLDRLAMLKYGVNDLRLFFENDMRFLRQFT